MTARRRCPDDGACHHECVGLCFRVATCEPLSGVFPNDEWPTYEAVAGLYCGDPSGAPIHAAPCPSALWRTYNPAGSLWCPFHGHVLDTIPSPPWAP